MACPYISSGGGTYTWDTDGNSVSIAGIGLTLDALDRIVEQNRSGSYTQTPAVGEGPRYLNFQANTEVLPSLRSGPASPPQDDNLRSFFRSL